MTEKDINEDMDLEETEGEELAEETEGEELAEETRGEDLADKIDAIGWGLFFIWVGIAFLSDVNFGVGLLVVGVITLGAQAARKYFGLSLEGFWVVAGLFFTAGGLWELVNIKQSLVPILLIIVGVLLILPVIMGKRPLRKRSG
jgi:hypothetical protein